MPITAYSIEAARELDLEQWLALNGHGENDGPELPGGLRAKAAVDIECSCCKARGAALVRGAKARGTGKSVSQGHFRFQAADGANPHHPLCDFHDEQKIRGADYLTNFASDRSALTRAIRDLVCRGVQSKLFSRADMRDMRVWFLQQKASYSVPLDVTPELLQWCVDMQAARYSEPGIDALPFMPEHGSLPRFNWSAAAKLEWARRNAGLFAVIGPSVYFRRTSIERPLRLLEQHAGQLMLDPLALREKYETTVSFARFAAHYLFDTGAKTPEFISQHHSSWGAASHALLALCALILFLCDWDVRQASAFYCRLKSLPPDPYGLEGNLLGLNPFHDYPAWLVINAARNIAAARTDVRPIAEQVGAVQAEIQARHREWENNRT